MPTSFPSARRSQALIVDVAARAADGTLVLVGDVTDLRSRAGRSIPTDRFVGSLRDSGVPVPFVLLADAAHVRICRWDGQVLSAPIFETPAPDVLATYDPDFVRKQVFEAYLVALIEAWLRDVAYRWKTAKPPGLAALERAGVAPLLLGGTTERNLLIHGPKA